MSELIKDLIEQAMIQVTKPDGHCIFQECQKALAELVVQECISITDQMRADYIRYRKQETDFDMKNIYSECEAVCEVLNDKFRQRFGIKHELEKEWNESD